MNKHLIKTVVLIFLLGCGNGSNQQKLEKKDVAISKPIDNSVKMKDGQFKETSCKGVSCSKQSNILFPDSTVNKKLYLEDYTTLAKLYPKNDIELIERIRSNPVALFTNNNDSEYLLAYQYEGDTKNSFGCFEIGYRKDLRKFISNETKESKFETESGLHLGLSLNDLELIKGKDYTKKELSDKIILTYRIININDSPFLKRYNMPGYFIEATFKDDKLVKILFGFDYP